jgi:outer membrane protein TolC
MTPSRKPLVICLTALLLTSCAVGPNFKKPAAPPVKGYTPSPVSTTSSSTNVAGGEAQSFVTGQDIAGDWWTLFHSKPLNALIERSLKANPNLKAAQAALVVARENVKAQ